MIEGSGLGHLDDTNPIVQVLLRLNPDIKCTSNVSLLDRTVKVGCQATEPFIFNTDDDKAPFQQRVIEKT